MIDNEKQQVPTDLFEDYFFPCSSQCSCNCDKENGTCEHSWDGEVFTSDDDLMQTGTCSHCGMFQIDHDLRYGP